MKRTIPLLIAALAGCVLIASRFIPFTETWGEVTAVWFDILEGIAFILGGGSLLKLQLKKISDRQAGWGYSAIILAAFAVTLFTGLGKIGVPPNPAQQFYGQSLAPLAVADLPDATVARVAGRVPTRADSEPLPLIVRRQLTVQNGELVFRGWMTSQQQSELSDYFNTLEWQCTVEKLFNASQPPSAVKGIEYMVNHSALDCSGVMADDVRDALLKMKGNDHWQQAVKSLYEQSHVEKHVATDHPPNGFTVPTAMQSFVTLDAAKKVLSIRGPMSTSVRDVLARDSFPLVHPTTAEERAQFRKDLESHGSPLNKEQQVILDNLLKATWTVDQLRIVLDDAGKATAIPKTACEMAEARKAGRPLDEAPAKSGKDNVLNAQQRAALDAFAHNQTETPAALADRLKAAGPFNEKQAAALNAFFTKVPTVAEKNRDLCVELLLTGTLSTDQRRWLVDDFRNEFAWRQTVGRLFVAAHVPKYPWSGQYSVSGSAFGWLFDYILKPLVATMFSLLAFYVASAAFRAFRAKNIEAILLLGTAFIILLGQTFAGYWLTSWLPANPAESWWALLRIENLRVLIMKVFQTAGQRAIMIGIALGLAATSLKVLLGIDRSYLGSGD